MTVLSKHGRRQPARFLASASDADDLTRNVLADRLDDRSFNYLLQMQSAFAALRTVASQLAGLLVLVAAGARGGEPDRNLLHAASLTYAEAVDQFRRLTVSSAVSHVHRHLAHAADGLGSALAAAEEQQQGKRPFDVTPAHRHLRAAYHQLELVSWLAPGFQLVDARGACCAHH